MGVRPEVAPCCFGVGLGWPSSCGKGGLHKGQCLDGLAWSWLALPGGMFHGSRVALVEKYRRWLLCGLALMESTVAVAR